MLCALCADVCPVDVISLVPASELAGEGREAREGSESRGGGGGREGSDGRHDSAAVSGNGSAVAIADPLLGLEVEATALLLDEVACIRCGLCIERCPPNALSMGMWTGVGVPT